MLILSNYQEQFERLNRWYKRFKEINNGRIHDKSSEFYKDDVYAFFMNCYHLKDWIINDPATEADDKLVENYINKNRELLICADICNGLKHFRLKKERSKESPKLGGMKAKVHLGTEPTTIAVEYEINTSSGPIDAFDLATKCMKAWEDFIKSIT